MDVCKSLVSKILDADRAGAFSLLESWAREHGYDQLIVDVLEPVLNEIGDLWAASVGISLAQAYVAAKVAEDIIEKIAADRAPTAKTADLRGPVVIGNIEDDYHALGRRMVATFLKTDGWDVCDMGNDVPAGEFVDKAVEIGAKVIGVSAMMRTTAANVSAVREEIDRRGLTGRIQLAVGGAVFILRPQLMNEVGGDGTARNALAAPALFAELWEAACKSEK